MRRAAIALCVAVGCAPVVTDPGAPYTACSRSCSSGADCFRPGRLDLDPSPSWTTNICSSLCDPTRYGADCPEMVPAINPLLAIACVGPMIRMFTDVRVGMCVLRCLSSAGCPTGLSCQRVADMNGRLFPDTVCWPPSPQRP